MKLNDLNPIQLNEATIPPELPGLMTRFLGMTVSTLTIRLWLEGGGQSSISFDKFIEVLDKKCEELFGVIAADLSESQLVKLLVTAGLSPAKTKIMIKQIMDDMD